MFDENSFSIDAFDDASWLFLLEMIYLDWLCRARRQSLR